MTTTDSVQGSVDALGAAGWMVIPQEAAFGSLLNGRFDAPLAAGDMVAPLAAWGSHTYGLRVRRDLGDGLLLKGAIGSAQHDDGDIALDSPLIGAVALRWMPERAGVLHPYAELGAMFAPQQTATFTRHYANGASGQATGIGTAAGRLAFGYVEGGLAYAPSADAQYALSLTLGRGSFHHDAYTEAAGPENPFPASFAAGTDRATTLRLGARASLALSPSMSLGVNIGLGHVWGQSGTAATVAGTVYSTTAGAASWADYGLDLSIHTGARTDVDLFIIGLSGDHGIGHHAEVGLSLTIRL